VGELLGSYFSHSLSLLSDAAHVFFDLSALLISFTALLLSKRYKKLESRAALLNSILLMIVALSIAYEAWQRLQHPQSIQSGIMLGVAVIGFLGNALVAWKLHDFAKKNINIKAAFYHVIGDLLASVGVILAALIIAFTGWQKADTLISFAIAAIIFGGALNLFVGNIRNRKHR
jgi:cobalt-zinc-cadmium efflux system protein